jgi:ubiquinone/menaquinone biosynthesis C-methylase UbiE
MEDYVKKTIEFYDEHADEYEENTRSLADKEWQQKFISLLRKGTEVLDVGCAFGRDTAYFVRKGFKATGIDLSRALIAKAEEEVKDAKFSVMDMRFLAFPAKKFGGVWCSASFFHLKKEHAPRALSEFARVLKKGGYLYMNLKTGKGQKMIKDKRYSGAKKFYAYYSTHEIQKLLVDAGFSIIEVDEPHIKKGGHVGGEYCDLDAIYIVARRDE